MLGAILGDIIGSPFEFDQGNKTTIFPLFSRTSKFTDDTVMSIAIADALVTAGKDASLETIRKLCIEKMQTWGREYPNAGYGARFIHWVFAEDPKPYNSLGNGSAMRVSSVGWLYDTLERTLEVATVTSEVSHNHIEGIKGAKATAGAIYLARNHASKEEIKQFVESLGYDLSKSCDELRPTNRHDETCMTAIPLALAAFLEGNSYEEVVRLAISLGGDTDTIGAIAGSIAEGMYPIDDALIIEMNNRTTKYMKSVIIRFMNARK